MSVEAITYVWQTAQEQSTRLLMMLALADFADEFGECWPGIEALAQKVRVKIRNAQTLLKKLQERGAIEIEYNNGIPTKTGKTNRYRIVGFVEWFAKLKAIKQGVQVSVTRGAKSRRKALPKLAPDPSLKPNTEDTSLTGSTATPPAPEPIQPESKMVEPVQSEELKSPLPVAGGSPKQPATPQQHVMLIQAYHGAIPEAQRPVGKPNYSRNVAVAKELVEAGITADQAAGYVRETYPSYLEWARGQPGRPEVMSLEHVKQNIRAWINKPKAGSNETTSGRELLSATGNPAAGVAEEPQSRLSDENRRILAESRERAESRRTLSDVFRDALPGLKPARGTS